jgi:Icc-related predicted phosphoesterase
MIIDCIADLHGFYPKLEGGDLLIVAGDLTGRDEHWEYITFRNWCNNQKYKKVIVIAGNHDNYLQHHKWSIDPEIDNIEYLCDSGTEFEGLKIWGIPWSKRFIGMNPKCMAFTYYDENWFYDEKIVKIPHDVDILITHSPPYSILDEVKLEGQFKLSEPPLQMYEHVGSKSLYNWLKYVGRPLLHVFGHIHEAYGQCEVFPTYNDQMMISVNASIMNEHYESVNKPVRVIL